MGAGGIRVDFLAGQLFAGAGRDEKRAETRRAIRFLYDWNHTAARTIFRRRSNVCPNAEVLLC